MKFEECDFDIIIELVIPYSSIDLTELSEGTEYNLSSMVGRYRFASKRLSLFDLAVPPAKSKNSFFEFSACSV